MNPLFAALVVRAMQSKILKIMQTDAGFTLEVDYFGIKFPVAAVSNAEVGFDPAAVPQADIQPAPQPAPPPPRGNHLRLVQ